MKKDFNPQDFFGTLPIWPPFHRFFKTNNKAVEKSCENDP